MYTLECRKKLPLHGCKLLCRTSLMVSVSATNFQVHQLNYDSWLHLINEPSFLCMLLLRKLWLLLKPLGSQVTWKQWIHTFVCIHSFDKYCSFLLFFFSRDEVRGRSLRLLQKSCDTSLGSLVIVSILPPLFEGRKQLSVDVKVIEQAELFWPF